MAAGSEDLHGDGAGGMLLPAVRGSPLGQGGHPRRACQRPPGTSIGTGRDAGTAPPWHPQTSPPASRSYLRSRQTRLPGAADLPLDPRQSWHALQDTRTRGRERAAPSGVGGEGRGATAPSYLRSFGPARSRGAGGERQPRALHVGLGQEKGLSRACPPPPTLRLSPERSWHLQIQPRRPAPVAPVGQGGPAALGVRWAQEGQLTPSLLGRLLAPCLPCCPAKGKEEEGVDGSPQSHPHAAIPQPGSPANTPGPCAMCTVATRGSSKFINAFLLFFFFFPPRCPNSRVSSAPS